MKVSFRSIYINELWFIIIFSFISGVFATLSLWLEFPVLRLWKEALFIVSIIISLFLIRFKAHRSVYLALLVSLFFLVLSVILSSASPLRMIYHFKVDYLYIFFSIFLFSYMKNMDDAAIDKFLDRLAFLFITMALLNVLVIFIQKVFPQGFLQLLGASGKINTEGVRVIFTKGVIRAPGLLTSFTSSGNLMVLAIIVLLESRTFYKKKPVVLLFVFSLFIAGLYLSTYKSGFISLAIYFLYKGIDILAIRKQTAKYIQAVISVIIFTITFYATNFFNIFEKVNSVNPYLAYNSIYLRVKQTHILYSQMDTPGKVLFGVGYARNGTFWFRQGINDVAPIPLDSLYNFIVSNFGFLGVLLFLLITIRVAWKLLRYKNLDPLGGRYLLPVLLSFEFFVNNSVINYPIGLFVIIIVTALSAKMDRSLRENSSLKKGGLE